MARFATVGAYLLALELDGNALGGANSDWSLALVSLFAVIQLYEFLLIAAAGFLVHFEGSCGFSSRFVLYIGQTVLVCSYYRTG